MAVAFPFAPALRTPFGAPTVLRDHRSAKDEQNMGRRREQRREDRQEFGRGGSAVRYKMREKMFSFGDDFWIENEQGQRAFKIDGKMLRVRDTLVFEDPNGRELVKIQSKFWSIRDRLKLEREGAPSATLTKDLINLLGDDFEMKFDDGKVYHLKGNILNHEYAFFDGRKKIAEVSKKWFRVRDTYGVQIEQGQDDIILLAATVAMDQSSHDTV
jgi:uncharacterized protein YxjI